MALRITFCLVAIFVLHLAFAKIPSYIHVCKRNDPKIDQCIINAIESLRPRLAKGIPEFDIPPMEPIHIDKIDVSNGGPLTAVGTDVNIGGASKFVIKELKADVNKLVFQAKIYIPFLTFNANYDVDAKILNVKLKGKGPLTANTTDGEGTLILKGHKETKDGKTHVVFDSVDLNLKLKNYNIHLENLFNGDKALNDAVNIAINENKNEFKKTLKPQAEKIVARVLLDRANRIAKHFTYEELFPEK